MHIMHNIYFTLSPPVRMSMHFITLNVCDDLSTCKFRPVLLFRDQLGKSEEHLFYSIPLPLALSFLLPCRNIGFPF